MPRLVLMRHAKAVLGRTGSDDFDRALNERGRRALPLMVEYLVANRLIPQRILCSSSERTRETLDGLLPHFGDDVEIRYTRDLYLCSDDHLIDAVRAHGAGARTLLLVGHNPAIQEAALALAGSGDRDLRTDIRDKFPTGAIAVIDFEATRWTEIEPGEGRLVAFRRPRELEAQRGN